MKRVGISRHGMGGHGAGLASRMAPLIALAMSLGAPAATVPEVIEAGNEWLVAQASSQDRVDALGEQRRSLADEYRTVLREIEGLEAYNRQLERQLRLQGEEIAILDDSIAQATTVDRQILPLMLRMVSALEQFVALDIPFLPRERAERLQFVLEAIDRVDVTVAEKFRQVLEAYLIELEFGRTIEAYTGAVDVDGQKLEVDFLRVGRIGLYYQTLDGTQSARWDVDTKSWVKLPASDRNPIREAIRVARKLTAPNLLTLPLPTAGDAS
ncbi:DUF3450 domain-containing protein [Sinimarinibacterium flocculans]|jgi:hypothetical protein|uniref:Uncharacterized protein DUF3450 n=3 Tax=Sinimarinibacterium TaxID=1861863 RepID=A0A318EFT5_9GAMM|nr:uncharacterized protein DUF3450 [Sinimarinibacterium flocculans]